MYYWPLQDAKAQLSEVVRMTLKEGPQGISVRGQEQVVLITKDMYDNLTNRRKSFLDLMNTSPLKNLHLDTTRDQSLPRDLIL